MLIRFADQDRWHIALDIIGDDIADTEEEAKKMRMSKRVRTRGRRRKIGEKRTPGIGGIIIPRGDPARGLPETGNLGAATAIIIPITVAELTTVSVSIAIGSGTLHVTARGNNHYSMDLT